MLDEEDAKQEPDVEEDFLKAELEPVDELLVIQQMPNDVQFDPILMDEFITAQLHDLFCSDVCRHLNEEEGLAFELDDNGLLVRTATHDHTIVVPHSLKKRVLWLIHYTTLAGHPGGRKVYSKIR